MAEEYRSSTLKGGLSLTFTLLDVGDDRSAGRARSCPDRHLRLVQPWSHPLPDAARHGRSASSRWSLIAPAGTIVWRWQFKERVLRPLRDLGGVMSEAGKGDLTVSAPVVHDDEIGLLAEECNSLIGSLAKIAARSRRSAESVSAASAQLSASSQEISSSTMEISSSVQQIAHGAELQSRKVEETSRAMEAINVDS